MSPVIGVAAFDRCTKRAYYRAGLVCQLVSFSFGKDKQNNNYCGDTPLTENTEGIRYENSCTITALF